MKRLLLLSLMTVMTVAGISQTSFTASTTGGCEDLTVTFTDQTPNANQWFWDFGDGVSQSNQQNPTHTFTDAGYYQVSLQTYDSFGNYLGWYDMTIQVDGPRETMAIYPYNDSACVGDEVDVWMDYYGDYNDIQNVIVDFGDGSAPESNDWGSFYHTYSAPGDYVIEMIQITACETDTITDTVHVGTNLQISNPYFQIDPDTICPGDEFNFWTSWEYDWIVNFGDGTSTSTDYSHSYNNIGAYPLTCIIQNGCGNTATLYDTVYVQNNVPFQGNPNFWTWPDSVCPNTPMSFDASGGYSNYTFDFGDGTSASGQNVQHAYANPGNYVATVQVQNGCGNTAFFSDTAHVVTTLQVQNLNLQVPDSICVGESFLFDSWSDNGTDYTWDFGDGTVYNVEDGAHSYASAGTYTVTLTASNECGNSSSIQTTIVAGTNIGPNPNGFFLNIFPEEACPGDSLIFLAFPGGGNNSYVWDFGDGTSSSQTTVFQFDQGGQTFTYDIVKHTYQTTGTYDVEVQVTNTCGITLTDSFEVVIGNGAGVDVDILFDDEEFYCLGEEIPFNAVGGQYIQWNFGDGSTDVSYGLKEVPHAFTSPGTYQVTAVATNGCGAKDTAQVEVFIPNTEMNIVTNSVDANCGQSNGTAVVSVSGGQQPYIYQWTNGDSSVIADSLSSGIYLVNITDANGCEDFGIATVSDVEAPTVVVNTIVDASCHGSPNGAIDINVIGSSAPYTYTWSNGKTTQDINNLVAGPYEIYVTDASGCVSTESITVGQPDQVQLSFTSQDATCGSANGQATVLVGGSAGPYNYIWSNGQTNQTATNLPGGLYDVNVIDANGCITNGLVSVNETNSPAIAVDSIVNVGCGSGGSGIYINTIGGVGPFTYSWSNGTSNQDLTGVTPGQYNVTVTGNNGCSAQAFYTINYQGPQQNNICMVSVDPVSQKNIVVWEKVQTSGVQSYNIYRESSESGLYYLVGNVPYDSLSVYIDLAADPSVRGWRYKITAVDSCGTESSNSAIHKTMHLTSNQGINGEVNLIWDDYKGFSYSTVEVWRYSDIDGWNMIQAMPSNLHSYTDLSPPQGAQSLYYLLEAEPDIPCVATRAQNHNTTRSNRTSVISGPGGGPTGVEEENLGEFDLSAYPNPTTGLVNVVFGNTIEGDELILEILDVNGRVVYSEQVNGAFDGMMKRIDLSNAENGLYIIRVHGNEYNATERLLIQK